MSQITDFGKFVNKKTLMQCNTSIKKISILALEAYYHVESYYIGVFVFTNSPKSVTQFKMCKLLCEIVNQAL